MPFDMLSKYAEQQLRNAYVDGILVAEGSGMRMCVPPERFDDFLSLFFKTSMVKEWPHAYAGGVRLPSEG